MTAINVLRQSHAVHLISDGAIYDDEGVLISAAPKAFALPHINAAIAVRGTVPGQAVLATTLAMKPSYDALKSAAPEQLRAALIASQRLSTSNLTENQLQLFVVGWSETTGPDAYTVLTQPSGDSPAWTVLPIADLCLAPGDYAIHIALWPSIAGKGADDFDPRIDGLRFLEEQRRHKLQIPGRASREHLVGGFAQLTSVRRDVVTTEILKQWPDKVGHKIRPANPVAVDPFEQAFAESAAINARAEAA